MMVYGPVHGPRSRFCLHPPWRIERYHLNLEDLVGASHVRFLQGVRSFQCVFEGEISANFYCNISLDMIPFQPY